MRLILFVSLMALVQLACAGQTIDIVTDSWAPYAFEKDNRVVGSDVDIVREVFRKMGINANIRLLPWKRCINQVKSLQADAILAISVTEERKAFLHYPEEPVSEGVTVFFKKAGSDIRSVNIDNPENLDVGAMLGYHYCEELDDSRLIKNATRVPTLEQLLSMLALGRIDLAVEVELVGMYKARAMGLSDKLSIVADTEYCQGGNYLAFAKKPGYEELATRFAEELKKFKTTDAYQQIIKTYNGAL
ncbi:MAG: transporter substrate-binding domain-containing protein [Ketobacteraceae bacterium]|nr:transporter substrate-binding domain-containing protein [Ketobacteraceae bacterium]